MACRGSLLESMAADFRAFEDNLASHTNPILPRAPRDKPTIRQGAWYKIFSPRLGLAWTTYRPGNMTVIRRACGILVDPITLPTPFQPGFSQTTTLTQRASQRFDT
jgi:hypothetical protein